MDPSDDPRVNRPPMSVEAGPSRCHMETSFYNILHSSGFAEWAARAEEQNERLRTGSWAQTKDRDAGSSPSSDSKSSVESPSSVTTSTSTSTSTTRSAHRPSKRASRSRKLKEAEGKPSKTRSTRSKRSDTVAEEEAEEEGDGKDGNPAANFVAHYSNYSSMDAELNILTKHLMQHGGC
ncbi:hypothetical protein HRG_001262 [Hirsutella rhossiliensis]|uniref:Uncharacterized protein n=1 Tax=Hirsutella rhossiliensis TaxID=111463 RepID=A0A9P8N869_9HYPO|nr:uncharacterized protein HRG_01262 [Hirsutella rhossiliensis]KAH0968620.1 hypothetical protein HRG_01262 [Hirsutella rhossiliensis]